MCFSDSSTQHLNFFFLKQLTPFSLCFLLFFSLFTTVCYSGDTRTADKQRIEQGIKKFRINIRKLQGGIAGQRDQIESSIKKERNLLNELEAIDAKLLSQLRKLHTLLEEMATQEHLIQLKEDELKGSYAAKETVQNHLEKRIKAYYKMGEIGVANVTFSTESMPRMLNFRDSFTSLIDYDKDLIKTYRQSIAELQTTNNTLNLEKTVLADFINQATIEQEATNSIKHEKQTLLKQIETQKELHEQAVKEMEKVADNLSNSLNALKKEDELFDQGFLLNKGKHPAPLAGEVITLFGQEHKNRLGVKGKTAGITIAVKGINRVSSIFEGKVRYASYLHGYGNTIIIDHGYHYFSILSRLEKILVPKDAIVRQNEIIALTGDTATLMEGGVYLEIRHGSTPLDPLQWLDNTGLVLP